MTSIRNNDMFTAWGQEDDRLELYTFDEEKEEIKPAGNTLDIIQPVCVAL